MIETELYTILSADATIAAATSSRIYPLVMPQNVTFPAITYQRISDNPVNDLSGYSNLSNPHLAINCWATRYDEAKELAENVHDAMNTSTAFKAILINDLDGYDPDTGLFVVSQDYSCWNQA